MVLEPIQCKYCFRCGDCCRSHYNGMILTREELLLLPTMSEVTRVSINRFRLEGDTCPFLKDNSCSVYEIRPCQCRLYHCGRRKPEDKKLETISEIKDLMLRDPEYRAFKESTDLQAITWGNDHGWNWRRG